MNIIPGSLTIHKEEAKADIRSIADFHRGYALPKDLIVNDCSWEAECRTADKAECGDTVRLDVDDDGQKRSVLFMVCGYRAPNTFEWYVHLISITD